MRQEDFGLIRNDLEMITSVICPYKEVEKAMFFGSRAMGNHRQGSDVDIAIFTKDKDIVSKIAFVLNEESLMPYKFDVVDYYSLQHKNLIEQINKTGKIFYENNQN